MIERAQELVVKIGGLAIDPNPGLTDVGAAEEATNIWFRRAGEAEPRLSFTGNDITTAASLTSMIAWSVHFYNSARYVQIDTTAFDSGKLFKVTTTTLEITDVNSSSLNLYPGFTNSEIFKGNLYVTTQDGVKRIRGTSVTAFDAGLPRPTAMIVGSDANGDAVATGKVVAYRSRS